MAEFGLTEWLATALAIAFTISVPLTLFARILWIRDARVRADMWKLDDTKRAYIAGQVRLFIWLVGVQLVFNLILIGAFAWVLYMAATADARAFTAIVPQVWRWVLACAVAHVVLSFPIQGVIRRVRGIT